MSKSREIIIRNRRAKELYNPESSLNRKARGGLMVRTLWIIQSKCHFASHLRVEILDYPILVEIYTSQCYGVKFKKPNLEIRTMADQLDKI